MAESSAFLMRSFSQPSPTSSDEKKGSPIQRILTTSISFGRFMSESLDWGKWSAFTHNQYLEEVEKYSKPGSVAEKKAYFEAHFKRRRAAALLDHQNVEPINFSETNTEQNVEDNTSSDLGFEQRDVYLASENTKEGEVKSNNPVVPIGQNGNFDSSVERTSEDALVVVENPVELANNVKNDGCFGDIVSKIEGMICKQDDTSPINSPSKPDVSSSESLINGGASKCESPVKTIKPVQLKNSEKTPDSQSKAIDSSNKRRSYTTSLHISINFARSSGSVRQDASPKIENSKPLRAPVKKYKNSVPQTSTMASTNGLFKHHSEIPQAENSRIMGPHGDSISRVRTMGEKVQFLTSIYSKSSNLSEIMRPHGDSISRVRTMGEKVQSLSSNYSKSSNLSEIKARAPTVPSPFTFKSEERAVKRREFLQKLEQKLKETEKHQIHAKRQFLQVPSVRPCFGKIEEGAALRVQDNDSRHPWRLSTKTEGSKDFTGKNSHPTTYAAKGFKKNSTNENASPNIKI